MNQLIGVGIVAAYDAIVSLLILKIIDSRLGLRVKREVEIEELDTRPNASWRSRSVRRIAAKLGAIPCIKGKALPMAPPLAASFDGGMSTPALEPIVCQGVGALPGGCLFRTKGAI